MYTPNHLTYVYFPTLQFQPRPGFFIPISSQPIPMHIPHISAPHYANLNAPIYTYPRIFLPANGAQLPIGYPNQPVQMEASHFGYQWSNIYSSHLNSHQNQFQYHTQRSQFYQPSLPSNLIDNLHSDRPDSPEVILRVPQWEKKAPASCQREVQTTTSGTSNRQSVYRHQWANDYEISEDQPRIQDPTAYIDCAICLEKVQNERGFYCRGCQKTIGCRPCIYKWLSTKFYRREPTTCPLCRSAIRNF